MILKRWISRNRDLRIVSLSPWETFLNVINIGGCFVSREWLRVFWLSHPEVLSSLWSSQTERLLGPAESWCIMLFLSLYLKVFNCSGGEWKAFQIFYVDMNAIIKSEGIFFGALKNNPTASLYRIFILHRPSVSQSFHRIRKDNLSGQDSNDLEFRSVIELLHQQFEKMSSSVLIGNSPELSPHYRRWLGSFVERRYERYLVWWCALSRKWGKVICIILTSE